MKKANVCWVAILTAVLCISGNLLAYTDGDGSPENPYQIANKADLLELAADSGNYDKCFILTANIDLATESFTEAVIAPDTDPFMDGFQGPEFTGIFDGNGHAINHLTIICTDRDCVGLFGYFSYYSQIKNLGVVNVNIQGTNRVGGLVGESWGGIITSCYATGSVSGTGLHVGGLIGENSQGQIIFCYATATVSGDGSVGGLVGEGNGEITSCYATGSVNGTGDNVGGLAGYNGGPINFCYATGSVSGTNDIGGLAGCNEGPIYFCYATGVVSGTGYYVGGLVGSAFYSSVTSCFWDIQTSGQSSSSGGKGLSTVQMKTLATYQNAGWADTWADTDWVMNNGIDYPRLSWEGTGYAAIPSAIIPFAGSGTETDPYRITTAQEFASLSGYSSVLDKQIKLEANLDLSGITLYPIGDLGPFTGIFDGNNHTISNATILLPDSDYVGLFAYLGNSGQIHNLGVTNENIQGHNNVGGLVGYSDNGTITSCSVTGTVSGHNSVGGLVGCYLSGTIESCDVTGLVNGYSSVGGLVGWNSSGSITSCHATGTVSETDSYSSAGGLVGHNESGTLTSCYATGTVSGSSWTGWTGGLVGYNLAGTLTFCYATGTVGAGDNSSVGGLVGWNDNGTLTSCYATGTVSGNGSIGGLVGYFYNSTITSCFWDINSSETNVGVGNFNPAGAIGKTTAQMKTLSTFTDAGWDFSATDGDPANWWMPANSYPRLAWPIIGDIAGSYGVNLIDFAAFATHWQQTGCPTGCGNADLNSSGTVDIADLMLFADNWLKGM